MKPAVFILALIIGLASCITPPKYSEIPEITFNQLSTATVVPGEDSLVVSFDFQDGDGDIGAEDGDTVLNAFLIDTRTGFPYTYQVPFVNSRGNSKAISGTIWITVDANTMNCRPNRPNFDTLAYEIYIVDRANNESNRVTTPSIILDCP